MKLLFTGGTLPFFNATNPLTGSDVRVQKGKQIVIGSDRGKKLLKEYPEDFKLIEADQAPEKEEAPAKTEEPKKSKPKPKKKKRG